MSVVHTGASTFEPLPQGRAKGQPAGYVIGAGTIIGDASAGLTTVRFFLPDSMAVAVVAASANEDSGAARMVGFRLFTGKVITGLTEQYFDNQTSTAGHGIAGEGDGYVFHLPRLIMVNPEVATNMRLEFVMQNVAGVTLAASYRALVWDPNDLRQTPLATMLDFLR